MDEIRKDFPIFSRSFYKAYLDNAATTHKPQSVIDAMSNFYAYEYAPVHRSSYQAAERVTERYEAVRVQMAEFIAAEPSEIVFTKGATEGINLVAYAWALENVQVGDEILISQLEHHANIVPWQMVCQKKGAYLVVAPIEADGSLAAASLIQLITPKTKLVALTHNSHVLGTTVDIASIAQATHTMGALLLVDAAQSAPRSLVNVGQLGADFLVFSAHKMMGPTGLGILYIKKEIGQSLAPFERGGGMLFEASYNSATWLKPPYRFEAGTPPIAEVIGLGAVLDYYQTIDWKRVRQHEAALTSYAIQRLKMIEQVQILGPQTELELAGHLISFVVEGYHPHDIGALFDAHGVAVRAGDHCAQPLLQTLKFAGSIRLSFFCYTSFQELVYALDVLEAYLSSSVWQGF